MSNRPDTNSKQVHGLNPQMLLETILRNKIYNTLYWKEKCFALNSETIIDRAMELQYIGVIYGGNKNPTEFICLILKLLQIQPTNEIIEEYLSDSIADYKYLRALAAFYVRLTQKPANVYKKLEPLYNDYRKLRVRKPDDTYDILHMDEFIEDLLHKESVFEITLPAIPKRRVLEQSGDLEPRISLLEVDLDLEEMFKKGEEEKVNENSENCFDDMQINLDKLDEVNQSDNSDDSESDEDNSVRYQNKVEKETSMFTGNRKRNREEQDRKDRDIEHMNEKKRKSDSKPNNGTDSNIVDYRQLDPNSNEYWIEMRKHLGIK